MQKIEVSDDPQSHPRELYKNKIKMREVENKSKEYESICLDPTQMKHLHAIRPYSTKQRKTSKRQNKVSNSPHELSRSKSKKFEHSGRKADEPANNKNVGDLYNELLALKSEYKGLKNSYNKLMIEKNELTSRQQNDKRQAQQEVDRCNKEIEKYKKNSTLMEQQIERIKKQCYKIVQNERFKIKKLEQTLQEKDLMIAFLRNQIEKHKKGCESQISTNNQTSLYFIQNSSPIFNYDYLSKHSNNISMASNVVIQNQITNKVRKSESNLEEDSLSFSRDKSRQMESVHSLLTNNNDLMPVSHNKKDIVILNSCESLPSQNECLTFEMRLEPDKHRNCFKKESKERNDYHQKDKDTIMVTSKFHTKQKINKMNTRRLQIITDENNDCNEETSLQTKKKGFTNSGIISKQKKKMTSKKKKYP